MNLHKIGFTVLTASTLLLASGCDDNLLDQPNPNVPQTTTFWKTQDDAIRGINATYSGLQFMGTYRRWIHFPNDIRSDEGFSQSPWNELKNFNNFQIFNYDFVINTEIWGQHYQAINRANQVIANVGNIAMDDKMKARILGEAHFIRGLLYFNLTSFYSRPVLNLAPSTADARPPRAANEQEAWNQVIKDLEIAKRDLPASYTAGADIGRATKWAATALLGRVYMHNKQWAQAATQFGEVIASGQFALVPNFRDNFRHDTENNRESIFEIQFTAQYSADRTDDFLGASEATQRAQFFGMPGKGWTDGEMRPWLIDEFLKERTVSGTKDPRLAATMFFSRQRPGYPNNPSDPVDQDNLTYEGQTLEQRYADNENNRNRVYYRKYQNEYWKNEEGDFSPVNHRLIRYADVLLLQAEALTQLGRSSEAVPLVNQVRARSRMAPLASLNMEQLMHERVTEMAGEGWRYHDLMRWGLLDSQAEVDKIKLRDADFNFFVVGKTKIMPIPRTDVDLFQLKQNDGC